MNQYPRWKTILLLVVVVFGIVYALPNLYEDTPAVQISARGDAVVDSDTVDEIKGVLQKAELDPQSAEEVGDDSLLIRFSDPETQLKAKDLIKETLGSDYTVALNLASSTPAWLKSIGAKPMKLGLDLRGGVHFLLAIDVNSLIQRRLDGEVRSIGEELRHDKIRYKDLRRQKDNAIRIRFRSQEDLLKASKLLAKNHPNFILTKPKDGSSYVLVAQMSPEEMLKTQDYAVDQTMTILRNRINELGIAEPVVQRQGANRIAVDLPGVQDTARAKQILGGTATLEFHLVDTEHDMVTAAKGKVPVGSRFYDYQGRPVLLLNQVMLSGDSITGAASTMGENGRPAVSIRLGGGGEALFYRTTRDNVGKPLAIVYVETKLEEKIVDGKKVFVPHKTERVINIATIQSALGNNFQITGLSDPTIARDLALLLRSGALPVPISIIEESTVGPSMGKANIDKGIFSIEIGFLLIVTFMFVYYRLFGLAANIVLTMNLILLVAVLSVLGATLTLPGIAGILLTLGMAVDANVLIFERIREELRLGMSPYASIHAGFERAFATIVDSNVTTLIAAVALFALGTGAVKGFAVTLTIGLLTSMFTAIVGSRAMIQWYYGRRPVKHLSIGIRVEPKR